MLEKPKTNDTMLVSLVGEKGKLHFPLTISCCAHQLIEHSAHLIRGRHPELIIHLETSFNSIYSRFS